MIYPLIRTFTFQLSFFGFLFFILRLLFNGVCLYISIFTLQSGGSTSLYLISAVPFAGDGGILKEHNKCSLFLF